MTSVKELLIIQCSRGVARGPDPSPDLEIQVWKKIFFRQIIENKNIFGKNSEPHQDVRQPCQSVY